MASLPLARSRPAQVPALATPGAERIRANRSASKADNTKRALAKNWDAFAAWCQRVSLPALPASPEAVEAYLVYLADDHPVQDRAGNPVRLGLRPASVMQALWAINQRHRLAGLAEPGASAIVRTAMAGIRRRKAHRPKQQAPLTIEQIAAIPFRSDLKGLRDKALLLVGFAGCLRRSELVALRAEDIEPARHGLRVYLAQSKTDALGEGAWIDVVRAQHLLHACPVAALQAWLSAAGITRGPIFRAVPRHAQAVTNQPLSAVTVDSVVKWAARQLNLPADQYGGHSLRAGKATFLARQNKPPTLIAKHGRWRSLDMVLRYYRDEAAEGLVGVY